MPRGNHYNFFWCRTGGHHSCIWCCAGALLARQHFGPMAHSHCSALPLLLPHGSFLLYHPYHCTDWLPCISYFDFLCKHRVFFWCQTVLIVAAVWCCEFPYWLWSLMSARWWWGWFLPGEWGWCCRHTGGGEGGILWRTMLVLWQHVMSMRFVYVTCVW